MYFTVNAHPETLQIWSGPLVVIGYPCPLHFTARGFVFTGCFHPSLDDVAKADDLIMCVCVCVCACVRAYVSRFCIWLQLLHFFPAVSLLATIISVAPSSGVISAASVNTADAAAAHMSRDGFRFWLTKPSTFYNTVSNRNTEKPHNTTQQ